jgi:integrase
MTWDELDGADWTLKAARNKTKVDHLRPLSAAAMAVIKGQNKIVGCPFVFSSNGRAAFSGFSKAKINFDKQCGVTGWTLHDLRRTARSLMSRAGVLSDHAERVLGHVIGGVRGTYDRFEYHVEKQRALEKLASQIEHIVNPPKGNVHQLRA